MCGCLKPLHLPIRRKGTAPLSSLRRTEHFEWTDAAAAGLEEIKAILATNPILAAPNVGEPMLLYIAATHQVVSAVLVVERETDGHKFPLQKPVYYVSTVLTPCKSWYPHYQKITYAVFMASRKLRHYFQECSITVASEVPLNHIINNRDAIAGLLSGPSSSSRSTLYINHDEALNRKCWLTSSPNGQRPNSLKSMTHIPTGLCILMAPKCWQD